MYNVHVVYIMLFMWLTKKHICYFGHLDLLALNALVALVQFLLFLITARTVFIENKFIY